MNELKFKVTLHAPIETVWKAWTDSSTITKWFSHEANIQPHKGGAYELFFDPNHDIQGTKGCKVLEIEPPHHLSFQWKGPDQYAHIMNHPPKTTVKVTLDQVNMNTKLTIIHNGWEQGSDWKEAKDWHHKAWLGVLEDLQKYLSTG